MEGSCYGAMEGVLTKTQYPAGIIPFGKANKELDAPFLKSDVNYVPACKCLNSSCSISC